MYRRLIYTVATLVVAWVPTIVNAEIPHKLNFQAILLDSLDHVVPNGIYDLTFRLVTESSGGVVLWEETQTLQTDNGLFNTFLGVSNPVPDSAFAEQNPWLEIQLVTNALPYVPRSQLGSVAFAYRVGSVDGASGGSISGNLVVTGSQETVILDLDASGDESVTLPENAVSSPEITDEPGIAQGQHAHDVTVTGFSTMQVVVSCTLDIPAPGYIVLQAMAQVRFKADDDDEHGANYLDYAIVEGEETEADEEHTYRAGFGSSHNAQNTWLAISAQRTYRKLDAGQYVFKLIAVDACSSGNKSLWNPIITAVYFPTAYGPVMTTISSSEVPHYKTVTVETVQGDNVNSPGPSGTVTTVDLRDAQPVTPEPELPIEPRR